MRVLTLALSAYAVVAAKPDPSLRGPVHEPTNHTPCCVGCNAPEVKYYSVDHGFGHTAHCGETCLDPTKYSLYHLFEPNLTLATLDHPCSKQYTPDGGFYDVYTETVTHGFPGLLEVSLDLYSEH